MVLKNIFWSFLEWLFYTGFTVLVEKSVMILSILNLLNKAYIRGEFEERKNSFHLTAKLIRLDNPCESSSANFRHVGKFILFMSISPSVMNIFLARSSYSPEIC